jgi:hypothetical protein
MGAMSGFGSVRPPVAGAGGANRQAPHRKDDQAFPPRKEKRERKEPEVPLLVRKWEYFFDEVAPDKDAAIRFYHSTARGYSAVIVTFPRPVYGTADTETAKLSVVEYTDAAIDDLALEVRLNDGLIAIFPEGAETPWFLDRGLLEESILEDGREKTLRDIIAWLTGPLDDIVKELNEVG